MKVAIFHHHLNRGGVSQVIQNHLRALAALPQPDRPDQVLLVYDGQRDGWPDDLGPTFAAMPITHAVIPRMAYDSTDSSTDPVVLADSIESELRRAGFVPDNSVLHTHNPTLGKVASLPATLQEFADRGWRQLLQVHDFAEDNRPENYARVSDPAGLYPQAPHLHYATLTSRDAAVLRLAGLEEDRLHVLPNPVAEFGDLPDRPSARASVLAALGLPAETKLIVYPVRGIRRKNLGEMLLLSAIAPEEAALVVTLAPKNPVERQSFDRWQALSKELALPCRFDAAEQHKVTFHDILAACDAVLTTSVAEGFGMVFLEAWLADRPLLGRILPDLAADFVAAGVRFDGMYEQLWVPSEMLDAARLRQELAQRYLDACRSYHLDPLPSEEVQSSVDSLFLSDRFDFGRLSPSDQQAIVRRVAKDETAKQAILEANPGLFVSLAADNTRRIEQNAAAVREAYSTVRISRLLSVTYQAVLNSPPSSVSRNRFDSQAVLRHFVIPTNLYPVRTET